MSAWWWLRSTGNNSNNAADVNNDGSVNENGNNVNNENGVRPAFLPRSTLYRSETISQVRIVSTGRKVIEFLLEQGKYMPIETDYVYKDLVGLTDAINWHLTVGNASIMQWRLR